MVRKHGNAEGFEGNAQSFRIVTKLSTRDPEIAGLHLTRATLRAILKYPWHYEPPNSSHRNRSKKWGAYRTEANELAFAQALQTDEELVIAPGQRTLEAAIMDLADDIAYATHDIEDFYRAGLVPLHTLYSTRAIRRSDEEGAPPIVQRSEEYNAFFSKLLQSRARDDIEAERLKTAFERTSIFFFGLGTAYRGKRLQKVVLRQIASYLIGDYAGRIRINPNVDTNPNQILILADDDGSMAEIKILKDITRHYVHSNRSLVTQQHGEHEIIRDLYRFFFRAAVDSYCSNQTEWEHILPLDYNDLYTEELRRVKPATLAETYALHARLVADSIGQMTDNEAVLMHSRLMGNGLGSILDNLTT